MKKAVFAIFLGFSLACFAQDFPTEPAQTGVSGVYEVMVATENLQAAIKHFELFGFRVIQDEEINSRQAESIDAVASYLHSVRMQNADVDAQGLIRILGWENLAAGYCYFAWLA